MMAGPKYSDIVICQEMTISLLVILHYEHHLFTCAHICLVQLSLLCVCRYSLGVGQEEMKQELYDYLPSLEHWANEYLSSPAPKAISLKM